MGHRSARAAITGLLATALTCPAAAQEAVSEGAQWEARPSVADFERLGPPEAVRTRTSGRATLDCELNASGRLRDCLLKGETPVGAGFGAAALRLAPLYRLARTSEVELEGSRLTFIVRFRYAETPVFATTAPALPAPPPAPVAAPDEIQAISSPPGRLMRIGAVPGWQSDFLDAARIRRLDGEVETYRLTVYAGSRDASPGAVYEVVHLRIDCVSLAQTQIGVRLFDNAGGAVGWRPAAPPRPVEPDTIEAMISAAACDAATPGLGDVAGLADAVATTRGAP